MGSIAKAAIATNSLSTLVTAVKAAGLVETLDGDGSFTVFAPNNDAFAKVPQNALRNLLQPENVEQLRSVLLRHVLPNIRLAADIPFGTNEVLAANGEMVKITKSREGVTIESSATINLKRFLRIIYYIWFWKNAITIFHSQ